MFLIRAWTLFLIAFEFVELRMLMDKDYMMRRNKWLLEDGKYEHHGKAPLQLDGEAKINQILMSEKNELYNNEREYYLRAPFHKIKDRVQQTRSFKLLSQMPKGALLHLHFLASVSVDSVIRNLTYWPNLYVDASDSNNVRFAFIPKYETGHNESFKLVSEQRRRVGEDRYNMWLRDVFMFSTSELEGSVRHWDRFTLKFGPMGSLINYEPAFKWYVRQSFEQSYADGVYYIEYRFEKYQLYTIKNNQVINFPSDEYSIELFINEMEAFKAENPDFFGAKLICISVRHNMREVVKADITSTIFLMNKYPNLILGHDLVGDEDTLNPLFYYVEELLFGITASNGRLRYFFHAGETARTNQAVDQNLFDALLLNTTRIGHGFALKNHPVLMRYCVENSIPIEVSPISNQKLELVSDLRNHPIVEYLKMGLFVVLNSDDPAIFDILPLTHDFFMAFLALTGGNGDLWTLRYLATQSIEASILTSQERQNLYEIFNRKWQQFITDNS